MFGIGTPELVIILVITMLIFGPGKLPQIGAAVGNALRDFKKGVEELPKMTAAKEETPPAAKDSSEGRPG
jgi:sec-independent protein translocase protein TatA